MAVLSNSLRLQMLSGYLWAVAFSQLDLGCAAPSYVHCGDEDDLPVVAALHTSCT